MPVVVLTVGMTIACVSYLGIVRLGDSMDRFTHIFNSTSFTPTPQTTRSVVPLSNDRFAIVEAENISVYKVDGAGKLSRVDEVDITYNQLTPRKRFDPPMNPRY